MKYKVPVYQRKATTSYLKRLSDKGIKSLQLFIYPEIRDDIIAYKNKLMAKVEASKES